MESGIITDVKSVGPSSDKPIHIEADFAAFHLEEMKWDGLDKLLTSTPIEHDIADTRISVFDRFDLNKIQDNQLFNIGSADERFSFYMPRMSPPKLSIPMKTPVITNKENVPSTSNVRTTPLVNSPKSVASVEVRKEVSKPIPKVFPKRAITPSSIPNPISSPSGTNKVDSPSTKKTVKPTAMNPPKAIPKKTSVAVPRPTTSQPKKTIITKKTEAFVKPAPRTIDLKEAAKEPKEVKEPREVRESKEVLSVKEVKDTKDVKESKEVKEVKEIVKEEKTDLETKVKNLEVEVEFLKTERQDMLLRLSKLETLIRGIVPQPFES